ncbi:MAG: hypothetical protein PHV78_00595 [Patescibacteria group bacterium]|nr:hypothetical protein [Patescibacteria group bacterium]MDD5121329.1 hypothetical protein [Patescibacteria group bacterium]MDD5221814.1 hypothetical protein [Patescibacteria group bacterium]MDD5395752.1 hypothetical protein [Patescibacteria group bacterium]
MKKLLPYIIIFLLVLGFFTFLQSAPRLGDGDSFYHAKITELMIQGRAPVKIFPWLPYTILNNFYYDHHFLFHIYLVPFLLLIGQPLVAIKVGTIILGALFVTVLYWFLRRYQIKYALLYLIPAITSYVLIVRLNLDKAPGASLIFFLLGIYFILQRKKIALAILSFLYVWLYDAWPIILITTLAYCLAVAIKSVIDDWPALSKTLDKKLLKQVLFFIKKTFVGFFSKSNLALLGSCLIGLIAGIVINPYFPNDLKFFWVHIVKIGIFTPGLKYGVGAEWYPYDTIALVKENILIMALWLFTVAWFLVSFKKPSKTFPEVEPLLPQLGQSKESLFLVILNTFFFLYTLKARRIAEYFIPLTAITAAFVLNKAIKNINFKEFWQEIKNVFLKPRFILISMLIALLIVVSLGALIGSIIKIQQNTFNYFRQTAPAFDRFSGVTNFMKNNTPARSIVFHNSWASFPEFFYHDDNNYYITGLDSTFFYDPNPRLYNLWKDITQAKISNNLAAEIKNNFKADYVLVQKEDALYRNNETQNLINIINADSHFQKLYEDKEAIFYQISGI